MAAVTALVFAVWISCFYPRVDPVVARVNHGRVAARQSFGKFLSPRLYVAYGVGLFEQGTNSLLVRYLLSRKLTLEASTGEDSGADVLYVVESGPGEARPKLEPGLPDRN